MPEKEKALIREPQVMEHEVEADRELLCEKIVAKLEQAQQLQSMMQTQGSNFSSSGQRDPSGGVGQSGAAKRAPARAQAPSKRQPGSTKGTGLTSEDKASASGVLSTGGPASVESITIATYLCDFGNVVVGLVKRKSFRLTNVGRLAVTFNFDKKLLTQAGITIEPDKVQKVAPNASALFNVVYTTRKTAKFGKQRFAVPVDVKGGPSYLIEFGANLTIPELSMSSEALDSTETLDFGKVCV